MACELLYDPRELVRLDVALLVLVKVVEGLPESLAGEPFHCGWETVESGFGGDADEAHGAHEAKKKRRGATDQHSSLSQAGEQIIGPSRTMRGPSDHHTIPSLPSLLPALALALALVHPLILTHLAGQIEDSRAR